MAKSRTWPPELEAAIGRAVVNGMPTERIYRQALSGELPGVKALPGLPKRTFFSTLARVRKRLLEALEPKGKDGRSLAALAALERDDDDSELVRLAQLERKRESGEPAPLAIPSEVSRPGPDRASEVRKNALIARLERLAEDEG